MLSRAFVRNFERVCALFILLVAAAPGRSLLWAQLTGQARAQISRQATLQSAQPAKVSLKILTTNIMVGARPQAQITLLSANDQPVPAKEDWQCAVSLRFPSGNSTSQTVLIRKGESVGRFEFSAVEAGLTSISVQPKVAGVRSDKTEVIVRPAKRKVTQRMLRGQPLPGYALPSLKRADSASAQLRTVSLKSSANAPDPGPDNQTPAPGNSPVLHIFVNDVGGTFIANGTDAAVISAVFDSPDFSPAPTDINLWFSLSNGSLDPPQPLKIVKGSFSGQTHLTSPWPADIQVSFVSSTPGYKAVGDTSFVVQFVPVGVAILGPEKLSVVDNAAVMIVFFDGQGNPVPPGKNWAVTLRSKESKLRFAPQSVQVEPNSPTGSAVLFPVSFGSDTIEAVIANYTPQPLPIVITGWLVLGLCLGGGVAGGLAAYDKFKGSWLWRIFLGILGGAVLCWLYVYLALPSVDVNIAHNTFSVFFVALIGGYMGTTVLDFAVKKFGLGA
jgi:uncharacterized membrane protein YeaQ/YmgE (transglycosylase-associated protein family)